MLTLCVSLVGCGSEADKAATEAASETVTEAASEVVTEVAEGETEAASGAETEDSTEASAETQTDAAPVKLSVDELGDVAELGEDRYSCSYEGVDHDFLLYLPDNAEGAPLVIVLHGYGESADVMKSKTHFEEDALPKGYAVAYVDGAPNPGDTTSSTGWNSGISADGNNDICFLVSLAEYLQKQYSLDVDNTFVVGFSNGAFMTHRIAMEASATFAGVVSVAGKMPESIWKEKGETNSVSFFQVTGEKDDVVPKYSDNSAKHAKDPAIEDVIDYWVSINGLSPEGTEEVGKGSELTKYSAEGKNAKVWNLIIKGGRHSWPEEGITGININTLILDFLDQAGR